MTRHVTSQPKLVDQEEVRSVGSDKRKHSKFINKHEPGKEFGESSPEVSIMKEKPIIQVETMLQDGLGRQSTVKGGSPVRKAEESEVNKSITKRSVVRGGDMESLKSFATRSIRSRKISPAAQ